MFLFVVLTIVAVPTLIIIDISKFFSTGWTRSCSTLLRWRRFFLQRKALMPSRFFFLFYA